LPTQIPKDDEPSRQWEHEEVIAGEASYLKSGSPKDAGQLRNRVAPTMAIDGIVVAPQPREGGRRQCQETAISQNAAALTEDASVIIAVLYDIQHCHQVKRPVWERERLTGSLPHGVAASLRHPQRAIEAVHTDDAAIPLQVMNHVASPAAYVQHPQVPPGHVNAGRPGTVHTGIIQKAQKRPRSAGKPPVPVLLSTCLNGRSPHAC
jgi:hypothetical protein